jgi:transposase
MARQRKYPVELLDRGARLVFVSRRPIAHMARDLGVPSETLRKYVRQIEADEGVRFDLPTSEEREEIKQLRRENYELRRANEILKAASVFFATELDADRPRCLRTAVAHEHVSAAVRVANTRFDASDAKTR